MTVPILEAVEEFYEQNGRYPNTDEVMLLKEAISTTAIDRNDETSGDSA